MRALNLKEAIPLLDPSHPLSKETGFYIKRKRNPRNKLKTMLLDSERPVKLLFTGFRGSGKSTELNILSLDNDIANKFIVVKFSAVEHFNLSQFDYIDVLCVTGEKIFNRSLEIFGESNDESQRKMDRKLLESLKSWGNEVQEKVTFLESSDTTAKVEAEAGLKTWVASFMTKLSGQLKVGWEKTSDIKKVLKPKLENLWDKINDIIREVERVSGKRILVIIEDLDKADIDVAEDLFERNGQKLLKPECRMILTIPVALIYSDKSTIISRSIFSGFQILPNIKIFNRNGEPDKDNFTFMKSVIRERIDFENLAEQPEESLNRIIKYSGGVLRELLRLTHDSVINAISYDESKISQVDVNDAINEVKNSFKRMNIKKENLEYLKDVDRIKDIVAKDDSIAKTLLHNLSILQYQNSEDWFDVNPLLKDYIK